LTPIDARGKRAYVARAAALGEIMKKILKVFMWTAGGLFSLALLGLAAIWVLSGMKLSERYDAPEVEIAHSDDPMTIAQGKRIGTIAGCNGCHNENLQGGVLARIPDGTIVVSPNVPRIAADYSDPDLARVIRYGVKKNGRPVIGMPSDAFYYLSDAHLVEILSYIRATPDEGGKQEKTFFGPMVRFFIAQGVYKTAPAQITAFGPRPDFDFSDPVRHGEYLARIACSECHGHDFDGQGNAKGMQPPDLAIAAAYRPEDFATLMKTGVAAGGRELGLMSEVARWRFAAFTDEEIEDLHAFFRARAEALQNAQQ